MYRLSAEDKLSMSLDQIIAHDQGRAYDDHNDSRRGQMERRYRNGRRNRMNRPDRTDLRDRIDRHDRIVPRDRMDLRDPYERRRSDRVSRRILRRNHSFDGCSDDDTSYEMRLPSERRRLQVEYPMGIKMYDCNGSYELSFVAKRRNNLQRPTRYRSRSPIGLRRFPNDQRASRPLRYVGSSQNFMTAAFDLDESAAIRSQHELFDNRLSNSARLTSRRPNRIFNSTWKYNDLDMCEDYRRSTTLRRRQRSTEPDYSDLYVPVDTFLRRNDHCRRRGSLS